MICTFLAITQFLISLISPSSTTSSDSCSKKSDIACATMAGLNERTFIMIKPDGVQRGLVGDIIKRFEQKGFKLVALKFMQVRIKNWSNCHKIGFKLGLNLG